MEIIYKRVADLIPYAGNPRKNDHAVASAAAIIKRFGFRVPLLIKSDDEVIDGHLRLKAAVKLGYDEVPCIIVDDMSDNDIRALRISVNKLAEKADWDDELLKIELDELELAGISLEEIGFEVGELEKIDDDIGENENYSRKIEAPIYTPKMEAKPKIDTLFNREKFNAIVKQIPDDIDENLKDFLVAAAYRHIIFNFKNIAEYYAHSDSQTQGLFEQSALVIIDFDKAIENGFVDVSNKLMSQFAEDYGK